MSEDVEATTTSSSDKEHNESQEDDSDVHTITMADVLEAQEDLLQNANAVLGGSDDKNCTYSKGYLKRQALYACLTCIPEAKDYSNRRAGVCLGCCYNCHDGHDLIELYTKRNFRCDCGNKLFENIVCNLENNKSDYNTENQYNHNFSGTYCTCKRPYPDPDDTVNDEMIQCVICEDWYHCRHLGTDLNITNNYEEMICMLCMDKHPFLYNYEHLAINMETPDVIKMSAVDIVKVDESEPSDVAQQQERPAVCKMPVTPEGAGKGTKFWQENWRQNLCKCESCLEIYESEKIAFLLDSEDTVQYYEHKGRAKEGLGNSSGEEDGQQDMALLNSLPRAPLLSTIAAYNEMKASLVEYLKTFADNQKIVRVQDIHEFFSELHAKKKRRTEEGAATSSYFCR